MKRAIIIHPFLFAIYPILALFVHNIASVAIDKIVASLVITNFFVLLLFILSRGIFKSKEKAGLVVSLFVFLFFSYGHIYGLMEEFVVTVGKFIIGPNKLLCSLYSLIFLFGVIFLAKTHRNLEKFTKILNVVAVSLLIITLLNIGVYQIKERDMWQPDKGSPISGKSQVKFKKPDLLRNIYYIILDAYARKDVLEEIFDYDNTDFINYLMRKGFYVAKKSRSNYNTTYLSMASALNLKYLNSLFSPDRRNMKVLSKMIKEAYAFEFLKQFGYKAVNLYDKYGIEIKNGHLRAVGKWGLNEFENNLINTTALPVLLARLPPEISQFNLHRKRILYIFQRLTDTTKLTFPIFVYAHIPVPHQPFVFGENGEPIDYDKGRFKLWRIKMEGENRVKYIKGYKRQLIFVNKMVQKTIDKIISESYVPPIIILQSDHGSGAMFDHEDVDNSNLKERMSILNAYYLPDGEDIKLYPSITPVNSLRLIFNHYFGTDYSLLKDKSYFSLRSSRFRFIDVTDKYDN